MNREQERWIWVAVLVLGVTGAFFVASKGGERENEGQIQATKSADIHSRGRSWSREEEVRPGAYQKKWAFDWAGAESPEELSDLLMGALSIPNDTERFQHLIAMLDHITPENWQTLWRTYIRQTLEEGRVQGFEWELFMNRVGELAGPEAMAYFEVSGQSEETFNRQEILEGWASADPIGAIAWMKRQDGGSSNSTLWPSLLGNVAESDPAMAFDLAAEVPEEYLSSAVSSLFAGIVQTEGLSGAQIRLEKELTLLGEEEIPPSLRLYYNELSRRAMRMQWLGEEYIDFEQGIPDLEKLSIRFAERQPLRKNQIIVAPISR